MGWIADFVEYQTPVGSPDLFKTWAGISIISGALERKTWVVTMGRNLYPNTYVVLVAPAGIGKSLMTREVEKFWRELPNHAVSFSSLTKAALADALKDANRSVVRPNEIPAVYTFNSLLIPSHELGVLLPTYDLEMMGVLTDLWDCGSYSEKRRTNKTEMALPRTHLCLIGACTPAYLARTLPEGAWNEGFSTRVHFIYSGETTIRDLFMVERQNEEMFRDLVDRLKRISELYGQMLFTEEAKAFVSAWHLQGGPIAPNHPRLINYLARRSAHLLKLCMVAAADRESMVVELADAQLALDWLIEAEFHLPDMFKDMTNTAHGDLLRDVLHFVATKYNKAGKQPVRQDTVIQFISQRTPAHNVARVLEVLVQGGLLVKGQVTVGSRIFEGYIPAVSEV